MESFVIAIPDVSIEALISAIELSPEYDVFVQNIFNNFSPSTSAQFITEMLQAFSVYPPASAVWLAFVQNIANTGITGLQYWQEHGSSPGIFAQRPVKREEKSNNGSLATVGPNWVLWQPKNTIQEVSVAIAPSLTGAFYLSDPTAVNPPNARGQNAVDLQMVRTAPSQVASGSQSFLSGANNISSGSCASAFGSGNTASGDWASAFGLTNTANGLYSTVEGSSCVTYGRGNHAEGSFSIAGSIGNINDPFVGVGAHAEGSQCQASSSYSHSGGLQSLTSGYASFTHGNIQTNTGQNCYIFGTGNVTHSLSSVCSLMGESLNPQTNNFHGTTLFGLGLTAAAVSDGNGHNLINSSIQLGGGNGGPSNLVPATGLSWMAFTTGTGGPVTPAVGGTWGTFNSTVGVPSLASYMEWDSKQQDLLRVVQDAVVASSCGQEPHRTTSPHQLSKRFYETIQSHTLGRFVFWSSESNEHHRVCLGESPSSGMKAAGKSQLATARHLGVVCPFTVGGAIFNDSMTGWAHSIERDLFNAHVVDDNWVSAFKTYLKNAMVHVDDEVKRLLQVVQDEQGSHESVKQINTLLSQRFAADNGRMRGVTSRWALPDGVVTSGEFFDTKKRLYNTCLDPSYRPDLWFLRCRDREQVPLGAPEEILLLRAIAFAKLIEKNGDVTMGQPDTNSLDDTTLLLASMTETPKDEEYADTIIALEEVDCSNDVVTSSTPLEEEVTPGANPEEEDTPMHEIENTSSSSIVAATTIDQVNVVDALNIDELVALVNAAGDASHFFSPEQWFEFCDGIRSHHVTFDGQVDETKFTEWKQHLMRTVPGLPDLKSIMSFDRAIEIERAYRKRWLTKTFNVCRVYSQNDKVQFLSGLYNVKPLRVTRTSPAFKPELVHAYKNRGARPHEWTMVQFGGVARVRHDGSVVAGREVVVLANGCVSFASQYALIKTGAHKTYQCMRIIDETICEIFLQ